MSTEGDGSKHDSEGATSWSRREFLRRTVQTSAGLAAAGLLAACGGATKKVSGKPTSGAAAGAPKRPVKIGFIALTDCASIVMADQLGYFKDKGIDVEVIKQASWPGTRDNLLNGEIDAAHCLSSMPTSLAAGIGGKPDQVLKIAMLLNNNGQSITLKKELAGAGYADLKKAKSLLTRSKGTLAMTFPGGTHDTWLRYWLLASGVGMDELKIIPIPPPQMVANMKVGTMDGFCVGEPWNAQAVQEDIGFTAINTQDIWQNHPEKALVVRPGFETERRDDLKAIMSSILKASRWLDEPDNRSRAAKTIGVPAYVGAKPEVIEGRMLGKYDLGANLGEKTYSGDHMRFFRDGQVNAPRRAYAIWFLAQYKRFGYVKEDPPYREIADRLVLRELYEEVAGEEGIPVPDDDMAPFQVQLDGVEFDPNSPQKEASRA